METQSTLVINLKQQPAVAKAIQGLNIGDKFNPNLVAKIKELGSDTVVLSIDAVVPEGYEVVSDGDEVVNAGTGTDPDATIPNAIASMVKQKKG